LIGKF